MIILYIYKNKINGKQNNTKNSKKVKRRFYGI